MKPWKSLFKESDDSELLYKDTGKMLCIKLEYGTYSNGEGYDDRVYSRIQDYGGNYTTDRGNKPKYLYFADNKRTGVSKEDTARLIAEMGYELYLKSEIDKDEIPVEIKVKDL